MWNEIVAPKAFGYRGRILFTSTTLPGLALLLELVVLTLPESALGSLETFLLHIRRGTNDMNVFGGVFVLAVGTLLALVVGAVSRFLLFRFVDWWDHRTWEERRIPTRRVVEALGRIYGEPVVAAFLRRHPIGHALEAQREAGASDGDRPTFPGSAEDPEGSRDAEWEAPDSWRGYSFAYAKAWLRAREPSIAVDYFEFEINLLLGLIPPLILLEPILIRWTVESELSYPASWATIAAGSIVILLAIRSNWKSAREARLTEHARAIRYLFFGDRFHLLGGADQRET